MTAALCAALAAAALAATPWLSWRFTLGLAAGLLLGALNPLLAGRALGSGLPFQSTSVMRLFLFSAAALAVGFALGVPYAPVFGVAAAQLLLVGVSTWLLVRR
jgi:hypothetical protein